MADVLNAGETRTYVVTAAQMLRVTPRGGSGNTNGTVTPEGSQAVTMFSAVQEFFGTADIQSFAVACTAGRLEVDVDEQAGRVFPVVSSVSGGVARSLSFFQGTTQSLPAPSFTPAQKPRIALMGDSISAQNTDNAATTLDYNDNGWINWALCRLGWPWYLPLANNFAVNGTTTDVIVANQLPAVLAAHAIKPISRVFISCGTNDSNSGRSLTDTKESFARLFGTLIDAGITPVHIGVLPRGNDGAITTAKRQNMAMNEWMRWYEATRGGFELVDCSLAIANNASAFGNALSSMTDGSFLHPISLGAFHMGKVIADHYSGRGVRPAMHFATQQGDQFNAASNPNGVVFDSPNPLMQGGTTAPTGMTTSGAGATWAVSTRTLDNGQTKPIVNCTLAASASHFLYDDATATGGWDSENIQVGDWLYGQCEIVLTGVSGLSSMSLQLNESDGTTTRQARCLDAGTAMALTPDTPVTFYTMTPPIQVQPYSGSGNASVFLRQNIVTASGAGSISIRGFEMRKWVGDI